MIHAMIDLETLSTRPNATILTIGGVKFDPYSYAEPTHGIYHRIDVDSQTAMGRDVMDETVEWWGKQANDVREEALGDHDRIDLKYFIYGSNKYLEKHGMPKTVNDLNKHKFISFGKGAPSPVYNPDWALKLGMHDGKKENL